MADAAGGKRKREDDGPPPAEPETTRTKADEECKPAQNVDVPGTELSTFMEEVGQITPTIPEAVVQYYLMKNGLNPKNADDRVIKLVALATQKFVADIATDALQHSKQRTATAPGSKKPTGKDKAFVLTSTDLQAALKDQGVNMAKPPYYV